MVDQELQLGFRLGVTGEHEFASVGSREMNVDHLDGRELFEGAARSEPRRQGMQTALQRDV